MAQSSKFKNPGTGNKLKEENTTSGASLITITSAAAGFGLKLLQLVTVLSLEQIQFPGIDFDRIHDYYNHSYNRLTL